MLERIDLTEVGPAADLDVTFASRLNVFTGDNGLGKSFLLDVAWWALTGDWVDGKAATLRRRGNGPARITTVPGPIGMAWKLSGDDEKHFASVGAFRGPGRKKDSDRKKSNLGVFVRSDGGVSIFDPVRIRRALPRRNADFLPSEIGYHSATYDLSRQDLWDGSKDGDDVICRGLIEDWRSWMGTDPETFAVFEQALATLSPGQDEDRLVPGPPLKVSLRDVREVPSLRTPYADVPVTDASEGVMRILGVAYALVWTWREHRRAAEFVGQPPLTSLVLLFDEVEAHLHPRWQRLILPAVLRVLDSLDMKDVQVLAVTHAPLVLASIEPDFDPDQDALFHFGLDRNQVRLTPLLWAKQGDAVNWLVSEAFGLSQARSREAEIAIGAAEAFMRGDVPEPEIAHAGDHSCRVAAGPCRP